MTQWQRRFQATFCFSSTDKTIENLLVKSFFMLWQSLWHHAAFALSNSVHKSDILIQNFLPHSGSSFCSSLDGCNFNSTKLSTPCKLQVGTHTPRDRIQLHRERFGVVLQRPAPNLYKHHLTNVAHLFKVCYNAKILMTWIAARTLIEHPPVQFFKWHTHFIACAQWQKTTKHLCCFDFVLLPSEQAAAYDHYKKYILHSRVFLSCQPSTTCKIIVASHMYSSGLKIGLLQFGWSHFF